jgi:hypothetical protein
MFFYDSGARFLTFLRFSQKTQKTQKTQKSGNWHHPTFWELRQKLQTFGVRIPNFGNPDRQFLGTSSKTSNFWNPDPKLWKSGCTTHKI